MMKSTLHLSLLSLLSFENLRKPLDLMAARFYIFLIGLSIKGEQA